MVFAMQGICIVMYGKIGHPGLDEVRKLARTRVIKKYVLLCKLQQSLRLRS